LKSFDCFDEEEKKTTKERRKKKTSFVNGGKVEDGFRFIEKGE